MSWSRAEEPRCHGDETAAVNLVVRSKAKDIGDFEVRRALPTVQRRSVGPFVFFDEMGPAALGPDQAMDVRPHPHINLATLTYLFEGAIQHRDSLGTSLNIEPGAVNLMIAGKGIVHSERSPAEARGRPQRLHGLQLWIALPDHAEEMEPEFHHYPEAELPRWTEGGVELRLLVGEGYGRSSPVKALSPTLYVVGEASADSEVLLPEAEERAVYVVSGHVEVAGLVAEPGALVVLEPGHDAHVCSMGPARWALVGGAHVGPRHMFWNFVSSRRERIEEAKEDWRAERFPVVPEDTEERIPLPE
ncbi:MAG: pirin family protein [Myxococcota bacterium]